MTTPDGLRPEPDADAGIAELQADIDHTREHLGETVDALADKLDVKAHAAEAFDDIKRRPVLPVAAAALGAAVVAVVLWRRKR